MSFPPGTRLGPYEILRRLGSGGMGDVFSARDTRLNRTVAIKAISPLLRSMPGFEDRFALEAKAVAALSHPNIVTIHDFGCDAGHHFMVMELLEGETLAEVIARGPLVFNVILTIGIQVANALRAAHAAGLLHRDVKPANIFITTQGPVKLMDFGIAKKSLDAEGATTAPITAEGQLVGTLSYMSPEQARGLALDERSDVFSLACVLYEMATTQRPFHGKGTLELLVGITSATPPALRALRPELPIEFEQLIARALAKNVDERLPSAAALADALSALAQDQRPMPAAPTAAVTAPAVQPIMVLPSPSTPLIGRAHELATAGAMLRDPQVRLLNCTGPAGVGKTRLAIELARGAIPDFHDGVVFVSLEAVRLPQEVEFELAKAMHGRHPRSRGIDGRLAEFLHDRELLLVIDNFEHVASAAPLLTELLTTGPRLKLLVTSRAVLNVRAERQFVVNPLGMSANNDVAAGGLASDVALFLDRARLARPDLGNSPEVLATITQICKRLDGLPLAIELAAARTRLLTPSELLSRIDRRLQVLSSSIRDLPERQRTVRGAIDWSYELLSSSDRQLLTRLAVFSGGATLDSMEIVCESDGLDSLATLVDNHLVRRTEGSDGVGRVSMLEMIREYALERLEASSESHRIRLRHAAHYLDMAERADRQLCNADHAATLERMEAEYANYRTAVDWLAATGRCAEALRMSLSLWRFWEMRGYWREGRLQLERLLAMADDAVPTELRAGALYAAGVLADAQHDFGAARRLFELHLAIQRQIADPRAVASAINNLGVVAMRQGDQAAAEVFYAETLEIVRGCGLKASEAAALNNLGHVALRRADHATARLRYEESLRISQSLGDLRAVAWTLSNLADVSCASQDVADAELRYSQSLNLFQQVGDQSGQASCMADLGSIACRAGDLVLAASLYQESLVLFGELGDKRGLVRAIEGFAALAAARSAIAHTLRLAAVAHSLRISLGMEPLSSQASLKSAIDGFRRAAGPSADGWWQEGTAMPIEQALQYALESAVS